MPAKILVVDDEPDVEFLIQQNFRSQIRSGEYEFFFARSGDEGLKILLEEEGLDMVMTDIRMPGMDGLMLLRKIKEHRREIKTVVVSAYGDMGNIRTAMNRGAFDFLLKPIVLRDLSMTIKKTLAAQAEPKETLETTRRTIAAKIAKDIATGIKSSLCPKNMTLPPGVNIQTASFPDRYTGGFFHDHFLLDGKKVGLVAGEITGEGIPGTVVMVKTQAILKTLALQGLTVSECLERANALLCQENIGGSSIKTFYAILNTETGELEFSVGNEQSIHWLSKSGVLQPLPQSGMVSLGRNAGRSFHTAEATLQPGDHLFLISGNTKPPQNLAARKESDLADLVQYCVQANTDGMEARELVCLGLRYKP